MSRKPPAIFEEISLLPTEAINPRTKNLDKASVVEILRMMNKEDSKVALAVGRVIKRIAQAVDVVVETIKMGGRVFYVGAGTSGRIGVLDAAECPPTFGTPPDLFQAIMAGGKASVFRSKEGAEDRASQARRIIRLKRINRKDVVIGLAACRRTPFVVSAIEEAKSRGAKTIYITCNPKGKVDADIVILIDTGPEVLAGSTRLKCGTAEKMVLNMISTVSMVRLGKVYKNLMVDLMATSEKLLHRSIRIIMLATNCDYHEAVDVLKKAGGSVKVAIVMKVKGVSRSQAQRLLRKANGFVRKAIGES
ncbi:MAG: N-acetylmuramic acid 6-phosphate etherase [bacterium]